MRTPLRSALSGGPGGFVVCLPAVAASVAGVAAGPPVFQRTRRPELVGGRPVRGHSGLLVQTPQAADNSLFGRKVVAVRRPGRKETLSDGAARRTGRWWSWWPASGESMLSQIKSCTFPNGLVLVAEPLAGRQSAAFTFLVPAGCALEPAGHEGLSGFACEMVQRGCGPRDHRQFVLDLDHLGVERTESVGHAHLMFGGATVAENLAPALAIYADLLRRPHLPEEHLESVRSLLLQELQSVEDEPSQKLMIELRRAHYGDPWGRPTQGRREALETIGIDDIRRFFHQRFRPNGAILGVAGRFDWQQLQQTVGELLGDWQQQQELPPAEGDGRAAYRHLTYKSQQTQIGLAWPSVPYRHPDYFRAWGAVGVLSGGMSARLFTEVRERRGLCYSVYAYYHTLRHRGAVLCYAGTTAARAQETLDVLAAEVRRLAQGIEAHELARLKARMKSALVMQQESSFARSSAIARDWYHLGRARTLEEIDRLVEELSCENINAYLREHPPGDFTVVTLGPEELEMPGEV